MTDPRTFTSEHRAWQGELVMQGENFLLLASEWNEGLHTAVTESSDAVGESLRFRALNANPAT